jgi:hypothetical protein
MSVQGSFVAKGKHMPAQVAVTIVDEVPGRGRREVATLRLASERITAGTLIERRVRHEVERHNASEDETFYGLVRPSGAEPSGSGWRLVTPRALDADEQIAIARDAFERGRVILFVNDRQLEQLDAELTLTGSTEVCFYQLVPLIGG